MIFQTHYNNQFYLGVYIIKSGIHIDLGKYQLIIFWGAK